MNRRIINIGDKYEQLEIIEYLGLKPKTKNAKTNIHWYRCKCDCGNYIDVPRWKIGKDVKSCGCNHASRSSGRPASPPYEPGNRFGKLEVVELISIKPIYKNSKRSVYWYRCKCDCGNYVDKPGSYLRKGVSSCGCLRNDKFRTININDKFGRLEVIEYLGLMPPSKNSSNNVSWYRCKCDCGNYIDVPGTQLGRSIKSCGCLRREKRPWKEDDPRREKFRPRGTKNKIPPGTKFGRLTVLKSPELKDGRYYYLCRCSCEEENEVLVRNDWLKDGTTRSCGCLKKETKYELVKKFREISYVENTSIYHIRSKKLRKDNTSGVKGVSFIKSRQRWAAFIYFQRKTYFLGQYDKLEEAALVRKEAEERVFGNFLDWYKETFPEKWAKIEKKET